MKRKIVRQSCPSLSADPKLPDAGQFNAKAQIALPAVILIRGTNSFLIFNKQKAPGGPAGSLNHLKDSYPIIPR